MKTYLYPCLFSVLISGVALADSANLNYVEAGYTEVKLGNDSDLDLKGLTIRGSYEISDDFYVRGHYFSVNEAQTLTETFITNEGVTQVNTYIDLTLSELTLGVGYQYAYSSNSIITADINYLNIKTDIDFTRATIEANGDVVTFSGVEHRNSDGILLRAGHHTVLNNTFQFGANIIYRYVKTDLENINESGINVEGLYHFNDQFALRAVIELADNDSFIVSGRYSF